MMGNIIAVHSYKGGTGKTLLSVNLASTYAKRGRNICLFDLDFRAPSLHAAFKAEGNGYWLNDYLNGTCDIKKVLVELDPRIKGSGRLFVGLANPATEAIREMSAKDRKWEMRALGRLLSLKTSLLNDMHLDHIIFDTSPGLQYSSINAIVSADVAVVVSSLDASDIKGTQRMTHELYDLFEKKTGIILNKILAGIMSTPSKKKALLEKLRAIHNLPIIDIIPCFCEVLEAGGTYIFTVERPEHPFTAILNEVATKVENLTSNSFQQVHATA
jgi:MinD-like ATPase involved in chromosome partitioning or flagellar assembly